MQVKLPFEPFDKSTNVMYYITFLKTATHVYHSTSNINVNGIQEHRQLSINL